MCAGDGWMNEIESHAKDILFCWVYMYKGPPLSLSCSRARSLYLSRSPHAQKTLGTRLFISGRDKGEGEVVLWLRWEMADRAELKKF